MRNSKTFFIATLLSGVAFANPALAQTTDPNAPSQDPNVQTAPTDQTPAQQENVADTPAQDAQDVERGAAETIVVTGSRIVSPNITSLAPVQVVGEQDIDRSGAVSVQEVLLQNPAFGTPASSTTNSAFGTTGAGVATVDLRDLGSNRTLVLINGRRVVGGFGGSTIVDLNNIPTQFIERIDVLTGGASSLYGSDAVAGVVNFIYKRNFEGLLAEGQYDITQRGDYPRFQMSATMGASFADNRGNIMFHAGFSDDKGLLSRERRNTRVDDISEIFYTYDPADYGVSHEPYFSSFTPQGRFATGGKAWTYGPTGALQPCFTTNFASCGKGAGQGPNGFNRQFYRTLSTPVKRYLLAERAHFDVTDSISFITEATYSKTIARSDIEPFPMDTGGASGLYTGNGGVWDIQLTPGGECNPFVPAEICATASDQNGNGLLDIAVRKRLSGIGTRNLEANREMLRLVTGFEGKLFNDRWSWDITYNYGRSEESQRSNGQVNAANLREALKAFRETAETGDINKNGVIGDIVCADPVARANGCVPFNFFGAGSVTPEMAAYVRAEGSHTFRNIQETVQGNLSGAILELPAGPLGVAIGAEYRREKSNDNFDALTNSGGNLGNALPDTEGKFDVKELYGEVNVPILRDQPFAKQLNLRAAGRLSDYSTVGSTETWSFGADYAPIDAVRFRGTYAKAVRAPNIGELFSAPAQTFPTGLIDPCLGITLTSTGTVAQQCLADPGVVRNIQANTGTGINPATGLPYTNAFTLTQPDKQGISGFNSGNPNLGPESSKSLTLGVVIAPREIAPLRNLVLSVDYWDIKITDAVYFPGRQITLNECYQNANPYFCSQITRYPQQTGGSSPGALEFINVQAINASTFKARGIDTVLQYRTGLGWLMGGLTGNARLSWTHYLKGFTTPLPGLDKDPYAGEIGTARDKVNGTVALNTSKWGLSFTGTYIGKSYEDQDFLEGFGLEPESISVPAKFYLDSQVSFTPVRNYEFYVGVNNLLDTKAPNILSGSPFNNTGADTAASVYDVFGRRFYAGARLRF